MNKNTVSQPILLDVTALFENTIDYALTEAELDTWVTIGDDGREELKDFEGYAARSPRWFIANEKPANAVERVTVDGVTFWGVTA